MAFRSAATANNYNASVTVTKPTGTANNDIIILVSNSAAGTLTYPAGFTTFYTFGNVVAAWKLASSEGADYTITGATSVINVIAASWSGRSASPALPEVGTDSGGTSSPPITAVLTGVTAATGDDIAVFCCNGPVDNAGVWSSTPPTNYTKALDSDADYVEMFLWYRDNVSSGATGNLSATLTCTGGSPASGWHGFVVPISAPGGSSIAPLAAYHLMQQ
jgi:hypothetical protein